MGKRSTIVISSSDDEDNVFALNSSSSYSKPTSKSKSSSSSVPRPNPKRAKRSRLTNSCPRSYEEHDGFEEMNLFCEDFDEGFNGFKVSTGSRRISKDLWVDKYKPRSLEELAVHKKKVEEVKAWFEERLKVVEENFGNNALLITGQAGVGKSATIHVIASHLGATVYEWNTPTPTIWQEHLHNSKSVGIRYTSKLDEFENFVEKISKYGLFPSSFTGSKKSIILLIDDLPVVNGKVAYGRLQKCLHLLVQSIRTPTAILITDYDRADSADYTTRCLDELQSSLQSAGTCKVGFNPITANSIKKTLTRICREEQFKVNIDQIDSIAKASGGDIRHAITSLQYFCLKPQKMRDTSNRFSRLDDGFSLQFGRDETLSLFHALGKFLHNKRETESSIPSYKDAIVLKDRFVRLPLKMDEPEKVLCQAHGQARPIADFLHENVLDFMDEEAIENAWIVSSYLSDADCLLASLGGLVSRNYEDENILQSAAASVAVRGVLFGNTQPLSSRWHSIRRPKLWQVDQSLWRNKSEMGRERSIAYNSVNLPDMAITATEYRPILKWLGFRAYEDSEASQLTVKGEDDDSDGMNLDGQVSSNTDDEIEDW